MADSHRQASPHNALAAPESEPVMTAVAPVRHPILLRVAVVLAAAWGLVVLVLWLTTANPVVLSRPQIAKADFIVTASRPDPKKDRLQIEQVWRGELELGEMTVRNLDEPAPVKMPVGEKFLVPLSRARGGLKITTLDRQLAKNPPLIYRATPEAIRQLQDLLAETQPSDTR